MSPSLDLGGPGQSRTDDLPGASRVLSQLSYEPKSLGVHSCHICVWGEPTFPTGDSTPRLPKDEKSQNRSHSEILSRILWICFRSVTRDISRSSQINFRSNLCPSSVTITFSLGDKGVWFAASSHVPAEIKLSKVCGFTVSSRWATWSWFA